RPHLDSLPRVEHLFHPFEAEMAATFNVNAEAGLKKLDGYLLSRSYISGYVFHTFMPCLFTVNGCICAISLTLLNLFCRYQASKDDLAVYSEFSVAPPSTCTNVARWYNHIDALLKLSGVTAPGQGVKVLSSVVPETSTTDVAEAPAADDDDDSDVDLFGEETEEEKKAAEERAAKAKASTKKKESGKSSVLLDVKPWDDETDMVKLEEAVRSIKMEGLLWGASKLMPVGYGIKKLQIMMTIIDDLVSVDTLIEDHLCVEPANEYIQSCDIVAFNKI
uniref:Translation elongation factor EF1B beta/delta subunit guanine nucleotide exchange domain-containing protein n=1 Tax=Aegilops tauschii subsp. strangulata TaxID=200361 RepID=A0A453B3P4_AEGTS